MSNENKKIIHILCCGKCSKLDPILRKMVAESNLNSLAGQGSNRCDICGKDNGGADICIRANNLPILKRLLRLVTGRKFKLIYPRLHKKITDYFLYSIFPSDRINRVLKICAKAISKN